MTAVASALFQACKLSILSNPFSNNSDSHWNRLLEAVPGELLICQKYFSTVTYLTVLGICCPLFLSVLAQYSLIQLILAICVTNSQEVLLSSTYFTYSGHNLQHSPPVLLCSHQHLYYILTL